MTRRRWFHVNRWFGLDGYGTREQDKFARLSGWMLLCFGIAAVAQVVALVVKAFS